MSSGLVVALKSEARAMLGRGGSWEETPEREKGRRIFPLKRVHCGDGGQLLATLSGVGLEKAALAADFLVDQGVGSLISVGLAGGLDPHLTAGDIIIASSVLGKDDGRYNASGEALDFASKTLEEKGLSARQGLIVSTSMAVLDEAAKKALHEKTGALAVDMESGGVAAAAAKRGLPLFVMRVICDEAADGISADLYECLGEDGRVRPGRLLGSCLKRPSMVTDMMRLRRSFNLALSNMGRSWQALLQGGFLQFFPKKPGG